MIDDDGVTDATKSLSLKRLSSNKLNQMKGRKRSSNDVVTCRANGNLRL